MYPHAEFEIPRRYALELIFYRTEARGQDQGHSDLETVYETPRPQDVAKNKIWEITSTTEPLVANNISISILLLTNTTKQPINLKMISSI